MEIKERRELAGVTQQRLADIIGVSQQAVTKWENGIALPKADKLPALAKALNCTIEELLSDSKL